MFIIKDFPLPPSTNNYLMPCFGKVKWQNGKPRATGRLVKTEQHRDYETACLAWSLHYRTALESVKAEINQKRIEIESKGEVFALRVQAFVCLNKDKIFDSKGKPAQIDSDNFVKPLQDNFFKILGIDDRFVFPLSVEKVYISDGSKERVILKVSMTKARSSEQAMDELVNG